MMLPLLLMGWEVVDLAGVRQYIQLGDYLYQLPLIKTLFYEYKGSDYYRTSIEDL